MFCCMLPGSLSNMLVGGSDWQLHLKTALVLRCLSMRSCWLSLLVRSVGVRRMSWQRTQHPRRRCGWACLPRSGSQSTTHTGP